MNSRRVVFRLHALKRLRQRQIRAVDVHMVVAQNDVVETYPDATPFPARLLLGHAGARPLHVVAADNPNEDETIIITVYEPDTARWSSDFRRRQKP